MTTTPRAFSRRDFFSSFLRPATRDAEPAKPAVALEAGSRVAIVQGRFCLAYQNSFCSVCVERCPVPGAIVSERGVPRVVADACTGCGVCSELCPAPRNAILMTRRPAVAART